MPPSRSTQPRTRRARRTDRPSTIRFRTLARLLVPALLIVTALSLATRAKRLEAFAGSPFPVTPSPAFHAGLVERSPFPAVDPGDELPLEFEFRSGDTVGGVLQAHGLAAAEAHQAAQAVGEHLDLQRVRAGQRYAVMLGPDSRPTRFRIGVDGEGWVTLERAGGGWASAWQPFVRTVRTRSVSGVLESAFEAAVRAAGADPRVTFRMADALQWDLDFNRDLRAGDEFQVLYEEIYLDGNLYAPGQVLALAYENGGRRLEAYRYDGGYYDADGRPLKKMFLRSPLAYSRVTSRFNLKRYHPVLKRYRPHYGVDYGTPVGTPVRVTANGVVVSAGRSGGAGKMVKVRHPNGYLTAYLHLSRFGKGIAPGRRVRQGDVIAYSGNTGLSTGPHLDYRVQKNGRWIDPLSLKNVPADPVPMSEVDDFLAWRDACRESLRTGVPIPAPQKPPEDDDIRLADGGPAVSTAR